MALIDRKVNEWSQSVSSLDDKPQMTAADLKAAFDSNTNQLKPVINGIIDDLTSTNAIKDIGASVDGLVGFTVFDVFASVVEKLADRYTKTEADSKITTETKDLVQSISFDEDTGIFTFIKKDGTNVKIDTALEKVPAKFELITEGTSVLLRITNIDGSTTQTDVTALMSGYTFNQSDSIAFSLSGTGNNKTVTATIRQAGVTKDMLASDATSYLQQLETQAGDSASSAAQSASNALTYANRSEQLADYAFESKNSAAQSAQTAKQYSGKPPIIEGDTWHTWNADTQAYTDTGSPSRGEKGDKGDKGDNGHGLVILGYYDTLQNLISAQTSPNAGDAYGIGTAPPYNIYVFDSISSNWIDNGQLQGPQGQQGIQGEKGEKGDKGEQGIQGEKGDTGAAGKDGMACKIARFTIGTSTSGWTKNDCDYLCDGTDDQVEINGAIQALPSNGGQIIILDGTYNITGTIDINKSNVKLSGNGNSTVLKRRWSSIGSVIEITASSCVVSDLRIDGSGKSYSEGSGISLLSPNNTIMGNFFNDNNKSISLTLSCINNTITCNLFNNNDYGVYLSPSCDNNIITCNKFKYINMFGVYLESSSYNMVSDNTFDNTSGIHANLSSSNIMTGNICRSGEYGIYSTGSNNTIISNNCNNNTSFGIYSSSRDNTITGNTCNNNGYGIKLLCSSTTIASNTCVNNNIGIYSTGSNNTITGNTCVRGTGSSSSYTSSQYTINCSGSNNLIVGNNIMGKNYSDTGSGNTWANNKFE